MSLPLISFPLRLIWHKYNNPVSNTLWFKCFYWVALLKKCSLAVVFLLITDKGAFTCCVYLAIVHLNLNCPPERLPDWQRVRRLNSHSNTNGLQASKVFSVCVTPLTAHVQLDYLLNLPRFLSLLSLCLLLGQTSVQKIVASFFMVLKSSPLPVSIWNPFLITSVFVSVCATEWREAASCSCCLTADSHKDKCMAHNESAGLFIVCVHTVCRCIFT